MGDKEGDGRRGKERGKEEKEAFLILGKWEIVELEKVKYILMLEE